MYCYHVQLKKKTYQSVCQLVFLFSIMLEFLDLINKKIKKIGQQLDFYVSATLKARNIDEIVDRKFFCSTGALF